MWSLPLAVAMPLLSAQSGDLWNGMLAPAKTPPAVVDKLYQETRRILGLPEIRNRFEPTGAIIVGNTPAEFAKIINDGLARWAAVIKASGAKIE